MALNRRAYPRRHYRLFVGGVYMGLVTEEQVARGIGSKEKCAVDRCCSAALSGEWLCERHAAVATGRP